MRVRDTRRTRLLPFRRGPASLWASLLLPVALGSPVRPLLAQGWTTQPAFVGGTFLGTLGPGDYQADDGAYVDLWQLPGTAGRRVAIVVEAPDFTPALGLAVDGGGSLAFIEGDLVNPRTRLEVTLQDGTYLITVAPQAAGGEGAYTLRIDAVQPTDTVGAEVPPDGTTDFAAPDTMGTTEWDVPAPAYDVDYGSDPLSDGGGVSLGLALAVLALGLAPVGMWARHRWSRLRPELFPDQEANRERVEDRESPRGPAARLDPGRVPPVLAEARSALEREGSPGAGSILEAVRQFDPLAAELARAAHSVLSRALETAEVHSVLVASRGVYAYVVVVPNRHEHDHLLRRHAPFAAGWREHLEGVRASLVAGGEFRALVSFLFFLEPYAGESVLLLSYADSARVMLPRALAPAAGTGDGEAEVLDASVEFTLSA